MNWRPNVLACLVVMTSVLTAGLLLGYQVASVLLGASLVGNIAQGLVSLDERNNPRPVLVLAVACIGGVFMTGLALDFDANQVALAASIIGNVALAIIKLEGQRED